MNKGHIQFKGQREVADRIELYRSRFTNNLGIMVGAFTGRLEAKAVRDRPWTDRTNAARNSIAGSHAHTGNEIVVALAIGVDYGKYLELSNGGKYRVIRPTVDVMRREFLQLPADAHEVTTL